MDKQILILTTTHDFLWKFERDNVRILQEMGYVVHYAANLNDPCYLSDEDKLQRMGVRVHHIEIARSPFLFQENQRALRQLLWLIRKFQIQVIHCHTPVGGLLGRLAGKIDTNQAPLIVYTAHGFHFYKGAPLWNHLTYYHVEKWLAHYTDVLIVINQEDFRQAQTFRLRAGGRVYRIPGVGLDSSMFYPFSALQRAFARQSLGIDENEFFLVSVGELNENKNQRIVLEALAKLKAQTNGELPIRYGICGDGFLRDRMEQWIEQMDLQREVVLFGYCRDVPKVLGCADAAVFPSKREGLGMAGLEALAMGIPVIASDNRGTREYMEHGKNGFVCRDNDVDGFIRGIEAIRHLSLEERKEMAVRCVQSVRPFNKAYAVAAMRQIYARVTQKVERDRESIGNSQRCDGSV